MLYSLLDALLALKESCIDTSDRNSDLHDKTRSHLDSLVSIISGTDHDVEVREVALDLCIGGQQHHLLAFLMCISRAACI